MLILDCLYALILLFTFPFWAKYIIKKKYRQLLKSRLQPQLEPCPGQTIWIHAVSVGEVRSLKSLIQILTEQQHKIILTVTTPAGFEFAKKEYAGLSVINSPLDFSFVIKRFISCINPRLVIFNELEIWPNWISLLHRRQIPMMLINGRISEAAFVRYRFFNFIMGRFIRQIDCFLVQTDIYRKRFRQLQIPAEKIMICGNIKADEAQRSLQKLPPRNEVFAQLRLQPPQKKIFVLASSHTGSEKIVIPAIKRLSAAYYFIIVPRHVQRAHAIARQLERSGLSYSLFSRPETMTPASDVLIYDRMGYLFQIMSIADIVFMGGTHDQKIGGHNLYEPAAMGKLIMGGPYYNNFPDIGKELEENGVYRRVDNSDELVAFASHCEKINFSKINDSALNAIFKRKGALACTLQQIQRFIG